MLKKIILKNFQRHKKFIAEFDQHMNVIVGDNDAGKSSIIRALHWVFFNAPNGNWMQRLDKEGKQLTTSVKLYLDDDIIIRKKGQNVNCYMLNNERWDNFKQIPPEILQLLNIYKITLNKVQVAPNIATQEDPKFMVDSMFTAGTRAAMVNHLTGVDIVEKAIRDFNKERLEIGRFTKTLQQVIDKNKEELSKLPKVNKFLKQCRALEKQEKEFAKLKYMYSSLYEIYVELDLTKVQHNKLRVSIEILENIPDYQIIQDMIDVRVMFENIQAELQDCDNKISSVEPFDVEQLDSIENSYKEFRARKKLLKELMNIEETLVMCESNRKLCEQELIKINEDIDKIQDKFCITCGQEIT